MKKGNNKMGVISWLINYKSLRDEYYDLLDTADKSKLDVENVKKETKRLKDVLEAEIENLNIDLERKKAKIKTLEDMITIKSNRILVLETTVKNRNEEIFYHYLGINGYKKLSQVEIARKYKLSHQRVQEIIRKTKSILRYELREYWREDEN